MFYVYIIQSQINQKLYFGYTGNLKRRFLEHNIGKSNATKRNKPYVLIYYEAYQSRQDAFLREKQLKHYGKSLAMLKKRIKNSLA